MWTEVLVLDTLRYQYPKPGVVIMKELVVLLHLFMDTLLAPFPP